MVRVLTGEMLEVLHMIKISRMLFLVRISSLTRVKHFLHRKVRRLIAVLSLVLGFVVSMFLSQFLLSV